MLPKDSIVTLAPKFRTSPGSLVGEMSFAQAMDELTLIATTHCFVPNRTGDLVWRVNTPEIWKNYYRALVCRIDQCLDFPPRGEFDLELAECPALLAEEVSQHVIDQLQAYFPENHFSLVVLTLQPISP